MTKTIKTGWRTFMFLLLFTAVDGFVIGTRVSKQFHPNRQSRPTRGVVLQTSSLDDRAAALREEAEALRQKANNLRNDIGEKTSGDGAQQSTKRLTNSPLVLTKWNVQEPDIAGEDYRLYIDIGREDGSWMDPRWGSSGRRIEFSLDVRFTEMEVSGDNNRIVSDNIAGAKTKTKCLLSASCGRLNGGFNEMKCRNGAYRIDQSKQGGTVRFYIQVDGTKPKASTDTWIPEGDLHFSLPVFGTIGKLSAKEGIVSVRQVGWHTGWRRTESQIVGVFRALRLTDAKTRDGF